MANKVYLKASAVISLQINSNSRSALKFRSCISDKFPDLSELKFGKSGSSEQSISKGSLCSDKDEDEFSYTSDILKQSLCSEI